jgi:hypothetical protein
MEYLFRPQENIFYSKRTHSIYSKRTHSTVREHILFAAWNIYFAPSPPVLTRTLQYLQYLAPVYYYRLSVNVCQACHISGVHLPI